LAIIIITFYVGKNNPEGVLKLKEI